MPAKKKGTTSKNKGGSDRGIKLGTDVAYDDAYGSGGGGDSEYVSSLPTLDEERKMQAGGVSDREEAENLDEGRVSNHPSTRSSRGKVSSFVVKSLCCAYVPSV